MEPSGPLADQAEGPRDHLSFKCSYLTVLPEWLNVSDADFATRSADLHQSQRGKLRSLRWRKQVGLGGLVVTKGVKDMQAQAVQKGQQLAAAKGVLQKRNNAASHQWSGFFSAATGPRVVPTCLNHEPK